MDQKQVQEKTGLTEKEKKVVHKYIKDQIENMRNRDMKQPNSIIQSSSIKRWNEVLIKIASELKK